MELLKVFNLSLLLLQLLVQDLLKVVELLVVLQVLKDILIPHNLKN